MGKGKSKRRRKANYLAAHPNLLLPPPPINDDGAALPAKLRRIMHLKSRNGTCNGNSSKITSQEKDKTKKDTTHLKQEQSQAVRSEDPVDLTLKDNCDLITKDYKPLVQSLTSRKRKQGQNPDTVIENLETAPVKKGLKERRKRFLNERKRKKKKSCSLSDEASSPTQKQEKILFGDVVQEPPKLKLPKKTNSISQERLRQQAIEAYRQRKGWVSRPGNYILPSLTNIASF